MSKAVKMKVDGEESEEALQTAQNREVAPAETDSADDSSSELTRKMWSVVNFEIVAASSLTYDKAQTKLKELAEKNVSGLCIITDEAAERI